ncbi:MAG: hypothetical protein Edafosvirus2_67 [Edafosvirus sp.]|uniref:Uncharacterized protein n=1 Tax=Edafosvirus sp. TaxID=2487765 RepID=A0A3G4ZSM1_9VIRU|nr:MAG: hypothetical protein Edafosvirus2_67 [Edafosvirus sp.]
MSRTKQKDLDGIHNFYCPDIKTKTKKYKNKHVKKTIPIEHIARHSVLESAVLPIPSLPFIKKIRTGHSEYDYIIYCTYNAEYFEKGYCVNCYKKILKDEIKEIVEQDSSIMCPYCGVDTVIDERCFNHVINLLNIRFCNDKKINNISDLLAIWMKKDFVSLITPINLDHKISPFEDKFREASKLKRPIWNNYSRASSNKKIYTYRNNIYDFVTSDKPPIPSLPFIKDVCANYSEYDYLPYCIFNEQYFEKGYCVYCYKKVLKNEIKEIIDQDSTLMCPHCGIDTVVDERCFYHVINLIDNSYNGQEENYINDLLMIWRKKGFS